MKLFKEDNYISNKTIEYEYDNYGNILSKKEYDLNTTNLLQQNTYEYNNTDWVDQLSKFNNETITYDGIGNPIQIGNKTLTWINGRQLNTFKDQTNNISYSYNKDNIRTSKTINNTITNYYLEGNKIIFEKTNNNVIYYMYNGDDIIGFTYNNQNYYYIKNAQNDIIGILDNTYNKVVEYSYDSWGNILTITGNETIANINPFRYRSYYYDKETNLYYLNSRYYNPTWGRFLNCDDYLAYLKNVYGLNLFQYANNNSINYIDNDGNLSIFNSIKNVYNKITSALNEMKNAFVFDYGIGIGMSSGGKICSTTAEIGVYKDLNIIQINDGKIDMHDSSTYSMYTKFKLTKNKKIGYGMDITEKRYGLNYNPFNNPFQMLNSEKVTINHLVLFDYEHASTENEMDNNASFIGIGGDFHFIIGGHYKIGFNINK